MVTLPETTPLPARSAATSEVTGRLPLNRTAARRHHAMRRVTRWDRCWRFMGFAEIQPAGVAGTGKRLGDRWPRPASSNSPEIVYPARVRRGKVNPWSGAFRRSLAGNYLDFSEGDGCVPNFRPGGSPSGRLLFRQMSSKRNIPTRRFVKPSFTFLIEKKRDGGEFARGDPVHYR